MICHPQPVPGRDEVPEDVDGLTVGFEIGFPGARFGGRALVSYVVPVITAHTAARSAGDPPRRAPPVGDGTAPCM
ncbi:hypothetical protein ACIGMX_05835 [Streptomyces aquilus]|uniref:hypothetical protein n=1 Tax=Streptomyces aquilus TaxID=2548456 RepID=UPI0037D1A609